MSRIGRVPLKIPEGVVCALEGRVLSVKGRGQSLSFSIARELDAFIDSNLVSIKVREDVMASPFVSKIHGTTCRIVANMIKGIADGFEKKIELIGVGYKADLQGKTLKLSLGYSHDIFYALPEGISIVMEKPTVFSIKGFDKQKVGQVAAELKSYRPPEPYKGKGVRIVGEFIRRKEGKSK